MFSWRNRRVIQPTCIQRDRIPTVDRVQARRWPDAQRLKRWGGFETWPQRFFVACKKSLPRYCKIKCGNKDQESQNKEFCFLVCDHLFHADNKASRWIALGPRHYKAWTS